MWASDPAFISACGSFEAVCTLIAERRFGEAFSACRHCRVVQRLTSSTPRLFSFCTCHTFQCRCGTSFLTLGLYIHTIIRMAVNCAPQFLCSTPLHSSGASPFCSHCTCCVGPLFALAQALDRNKGHHTGLPQIAASAEVAFH